MRSGKGVPRVDLPAEAGARDMAENAAEGKAPATADCPSALRKTVRTRTEPPCRIDF